MFILMTVIEYVGEVHHILDPVISSFVQIINSTYEFVTEVILLSYLY